MLVDMVHIYIYYTWEGKKNKSVGKERENEDKMVQRDGQIDENMGSNC